MSIINYQLTRVTIELKIILDYLYEYGGGAKKDPKKAFEYYKLTADQGNSNAQLNVGRAHEYEIGVEKDLERNHLSILNYQLTRVTLELNMMLVILTKMG